ncbi:hypothetical protein [Lysinibacillus xylanilyticus]|uniref:hypothetical protein n=1 Tax=Lysinibacillus xylanilyticus TaxID=582475 RepID=UPI0037F90254
MGQRDVGHSVIATGRGVLRLSSSISMVFGYPLKSDLKPYSFHHLLRWKTSVTAVSLTLQKTFAKRS